MLIGIKIKKTREIGVKMFKQFGGEIFDKIEEYESIINMKLPNDYKQFLVNTNGGQFVNELHTFWIEEL